MDVMEGEQTWPTEEELDAADKESKKVAKVPKGTSDYQAAWITEDVVNDDDNDDGESEDEYGSDDDKNMAGLEA